MDFVSFGPCFHRHHTILLCQLLQNFCLCPLLREFASCCLFRLSHWILSSHMIEDRVLHCIGFFYISGKWYQQMKTSDMFNHTLLPFPSAFVFYLQYRLRGCLHLSGGNPYEAPKSNLAVYNIGLRCDSGGSGSNTAKLLPIIADCRCSGHTTL